MYLYASKTRRWRYTSIRSNSASGTTRHLPLKGKAHCRILISDRDFVTASEPTRFSFSEKEKLRKRKTAQGTAPRSEPRFAPANRDEIKSRGSMRLRPPRPPGERASRESQTTEILCRAEKVSVFGQKMFVREPRGTVRLSLPLEGKVPSSSACGTTTD